MYPVDAVELNFSIQFWPKFIYNAHRFVGFLSGDYEELHVGMEQFDEVELSEL